MCRLTFVVVCLAVISLGAGGCGKGRGVISKNPLVITPALALDALPGRTIFYNGPALAWLQQKKPELLTPDERQPLSGRAKTFFQAVQNPKLFRQLDRQLRFDTILLVGDPSQFRPLLDHLLGAKDWQLAYLDHTAVIFSRGEQPAWQPGKLSELRSKLTGLKVREEALVLAQVAGKLTAVRQFGAAKQWLQEAEKKDAGLPEVWSAWGQYYLAIGDWKQAEASADEALKREQENIAALGVKAQALYATKRFMEAYRFSDRLLKVRSEDPGILFYHAKIAHEAKQFPEEIAALQKLIKLAGANGGRVDPGYRVYLAQAYASNGQAEAALVEFALALEDPELPVEQRQFAEETRTLILQKVQGKK